VRQQTIRITDLDSRRLQNLIKGSKQSSARDRGIFDGLERQLDDAEVTPASRIGPDVVTMNSQVLVTDLDRGQSFDFQVVFPRASESAAKRISVLAPLGLAVLGRRVGEEITWKVPGGLRRLRVDELLFQPERDGKDVAPYA
jgi:regulator of nucleoside diphosphate kinase